VTRFVGPDLQVKNRLMALGAARISGKILGRQSSERETMHCARITTESGSARLLHTDLCEDSPCHHVSFCGRRVTLCEIRNLLPGLWSRSPSDFGRLEPEPKKIWWWSRSLEFGFRFHRHSLWGKRVVEKISKKTDVEKAMVVDVTIRNYRVTPAPGGTRL